MTNLLFRQNVILNITLRDHLPRQDDQPIDHITQLLDIPRPVVLLQVLDRIFADVFPGDAIVAARNKYGKIYLPTSVGTKGIEINHTEIEDLYMSNSTLKCELAVVNSNLTT